MLFELVVLAVVEFHHFRVFCQVGIQSPPTFSQTLSWDLHPRCQ
jgi:hypothetical protein